MTEWRDISNVPLDGRTIKIREENFFRFKLYKPNSTQFKSGKKGRWQKMDEHGFWNNCPDPYGDWMPLPEPPEDV